MTPREKKAVTLAVAALLAFLFLQFLLLPMLAEGRRLKKNIATQEDRLAEMRRLVADGQAGSSGQAHSQSTMSEALKQRGRDFTLFSFLEQAAAQSRVKGHIEAMQPVQAGPEEDEGAGGSIVELQVQNVSLSRLVHFLDLVESPQNLVAVERLSIQGGGMEGAFLNASLRVRTVEMTDEAPSVAPVTPVAPGGAKP